MKPLNLVALLVFLAGTVWALTRSELTVREIQSAYYSTIRVFLKTGSALETHSRRFLDEVRSAKELEIENQNLRGEVGGLRLMQQRFRELEDENAQLRHALNFQKQTKFEVVAAHVIRRQPTTWWQTIEIDRGSDSGIGIQQMVLSNEGLVGKIDRVDKTGSTVILLTDEKCQVSAKVEGSTEVGIVSGQRGANDQGTPLLRLRFLSKDAKIKVGSRVYTTGRGGLFQPNILLGTISSVENGALDSEAFVRPSVNFVDPGTVFVVLNRELETK